MCVYVCVPGCDEEPRCSIADLRDADLARFHSCSLYPDTHECGSYKDPLRQRCGLVLDTPPKNTYRKTGNQSASQPPLPPSDQTSRAQGKLGFPLKVKVPLESRT